MNICSSAWGSWPRKYLETKYTSCCDFCAINISTMTDASTKAALAALVNRIVNGKPHTAGLCSPCYQQKTHSRGLGKYSSIYLAGSKITLFSMRVFLGTFSQPNFSLRPVSIVLILSRTSKPSTTVPNTA